METETESEIPEPIPSNSIEEVDPSQKLEGSYEAVTKDQTHDATLAKYKIKEDIRTVKNQNTTFFEDQRAVQRLQEEQKGSMNLEDTGHKPEGECKGGKEDIQNEVMRTAILNEVANIGYDKAETSQNISKWSIEKESSAMHLRKVSTEDGTLKEVQDCALLSIEKCTEEIGDNFKKEIVEVKTAEFPNKRPELSPKTEASEGDRIQSQTSVDFVDSSKHVPELSEEISHEAEKSKDKLSSKLITAIMGQGTSQPQESEVDSSKLARETSTSSEERSQGTVETGSMDEKARKVTLDQNSHSLIQPTSECENKYKETRNLENIGASEVKEEMKRSLDAMAESEDQAAKAITKAENAANQPPLGEELEKTAQEPPLDSSEQELGSTLTNRKIKDEMQEVDYGQKNSTYFTPKESEDMCLDRISMELQQASKIESEDIKKESPNEQEEKDAKPQKVLILDSDIPASTAKDDSFVGRKKNTELNEASDFVGSATSKEDEKETLFSQKKESEGRRLETPINEVSGECQTDDQEVNTERDLQDKYDHVKTPEETLEGEANAFDAKLEAEISHFISEEQETESPSSIDRTATSKMKDEADEDPDASPADEVPEEEAVNQPQETTQLASDEPIHVIHEKNKDNREGAVKKELHPIDEEIPTNDSNAPSLIKAAQEQALEKGNQMTEEDERHTSDFTMQATDEVNLPNRSSHGDPAKDVVTIKEISAKIHETLDDYRCVQEINANEVAKAPMPEQENIVVLASVEQATAEANFRGNPDEHDTTTSDMVMENQNQCPPCFGEETIKSIHQEDNMGGKQEDKIATKLKVEDRTQGSGAIGDQKDKINAAHEAPNYEISNGTVPEGLEKPGTNASIRKKIMEETQKSQMVKDTSRELVREETYKKSQHKIDMKENTVSDSKLKLNLEDQEQRLGDEKDLKDEANEVSDGSENAVSSKRMDWQIIKVETMKDLHQAPIKKDTIEAGIEEVKKNGEVIEKEATNLVPRDQNHETSCKDDAIKNNMINQEFRSNDVSLVEQQLATPPSTNEEGIMAIKDKVDKDLDTSPTTNSPAEEANQSKEVRQIVSKKIHRIHGTDEDNKAAAEDKNGEEELNEAKNPKDTSSSLVSYPGEIVEVLHSQYQQIPTSYASSSPTEASHENIPEIEGHMARDEQRYGLVIVHRADHEAKLQIEETEGEPIKDEVQAEDILHKEGEKMNDYIHVHEITSGNEGGETPVQDQEDVVLFSSVETPVQEQEDTVLFSFVEIPVQGQEDMVLFSSVEIPGQEEEDMVFLTFVEQDNREQSIKDNPNNHDTTRSLMAEEQSLLKVYVGEETVNKTHQDELEAKKVDKITTELETKEQCQISGAIEYQTEKITEINGNPICEILNEEVPEVLDKAVTADKMEKQETEENRTAKNVCLILAGEDTCKKNHHEDKGVEMFNDVEITLHLEDQSQEELAGEDLGANETNKTTNYQISREEVAIATENGGSSEKTDIKIIEDQAVRVPFMAAIGEEATGKDHQEENKDEPEVEKVATNLEPKDQNHESRSKYGTIEKQVLNEEVNSSHFVPVDPDFVTTASTVKRMDTVAMKKADTDVSSTRSPPAEEAADGEAVNEPQEVSNHGTELINESIRIKEENIECTREAKVVAEEFTAVGKLKTTSSNLAHIPSNIRENLHPKDQEVPTNDLNASSLTEISQEKTPEKKGHTSKEERDGLVLIKHKAGETSLATGKKEEYPVKNEASAKDNLKKEAEKMNDIGTNIAHGEGETPIPEQQQRAIFLSIEQALADNSFRAGHKVHDTGGNLVFDKQSQVKMSSILEVQINKSEKTGSTNLGNSDSSSEKLSHLSDASDKELSQKAYSEMLPEVTKVSQNSQKLEKAPDATTEESTQKNKSTGQEDISSVPQYSIRKSIWKDEDQMHGEVTESKEKAVYYGEDTLINDVEEELLDIDEVSLSDLLKSTKFSSDMVSSDTDSITNDEAEELLVDEVSLKDLLISTKETSHMAASNADPTPPANNRELQNKETQAIQRFKEKITVEEIHESHEEPEGYHKKMNAGFNLPVMLEAPRHEDIKPTHKKPHNILSGVGSTLKHSIARLKKAIACNVPPAEASIIGMKK